MNVDFPDMGGGIIQDLPAEQLDRNQWSDGDNVRFVRAQVTRMPGHTEVLGSASASGTVGSEALGNAIWLQHINDSNENPWWVYCDLDKIYVADGATHYDISFSATASSSMTGMAGFSANADFGWNGGNFNGLVVINSHAQEPRYWEPDAGNKTEKLPNWPAGHTCRVLRPYKTFLIAIGVNEGTGFNENIVQWPTAADVGGVPPSWDYADTTEDAGRFEIDDGFGNLVDGQQLRNDFFVYAEQAIYRISPIPGGNIFSIRRQFSNVGLLTRNCIATVRDMHAFFGNGDIYMHDGQTMRSIVTKKWKKWVFDQLGDNWRRSYVAVNHANNEVWFCFPTGADEYATKALVWDFDDNVLSSRDLVEPARGGAPFIAVGRIPAQGADDSFDSGADLEFDEEKQILFNAASSEKNVPGMLMTQYYSSSASASISLFFEIDSGLTFDTDNFNAFVEKDCIPLGRDGRFSQYEEYQVHAIRPRVRSTTGGNLHVKIGMRDSVGDAENFVDSATFSIGVDEKVDVRATGTVCTVRFESDEAVDWELNGFSVEYDIVGSRPR